MQLVPLVQGSNLTQSTQIQCCDMYSKGLGYQFTYCDSGVGVYILDEKKGSATDLEYLNLPYADIGFNNLPWDQLYAVVDSICGVSANVTGNVSAGNVTIEDANNINVDWALFF